MGGASGWDSDATVFRRIARRIGRYATRPRSGAGVVVDVRHVRRLAQVCGYVKGAHQETEEGTPDMRGFTWFGASAIPFGFGLALFRARTSTFPLSELLGRTWAKRMRYADAEDQPRRAGPRRRNEGHGLSIGSLCPVPLDSRLRRPLRNLPDEATPGVVNDTILAKPPTPLDTGLRRYDGCAKVSLRGTSAQLAGEALTA